MYFNGFIYYFYIKIKIIIITFCFFTAFDGFGDVLKPEGGIGGGGAPNAGVMMASATTTAGNTAPAAAGPQKLISGDLDMSLSSLVENLNIKGPAQKCVFHLFFCIIIKIKKT